MGILKPPEVRTGPLCRICGQPEAGHPKDVVQFHNFTAEEPPPKVVVEVVEGPH